MYKINFIVASAMFLLFQGPVFANIPAPADMTPDNTAIIVIDIQNDFLQKGKGRPQGSLAVPNADDAYVAKLYNILMRAQTNGFRHIFASQDFHPQKHISFASSHPGKNPFIDIIKILINGQEKEQELWPDHCVQNTPGADIALKFPFEHIVKKGKNREFDSYSAFKDDNGTSTGLTGLLRKLKIKYVFVLGVATDYCVKASAKDSAADGFTTYLVEDLSHAVAERFGPDSKELEGVKQAIRSIPVAPRGKKVEVIQSTEPIFKSIVAKAARVADVKQGSLAGKIAASQSRQPQPAIQHRPPQIAAH